jgi:hypothetical protein
MVPGGTLENAVHVNPSSAEEYTPPLEDTPYHILPLYVIFAMDMDTGLKVFPSTER